MANIVLIPARGGSKGIKHKNIIPILGKPLIYYTLNACQHSKSVDKIVVATDSKEIGDVSLGFGFDKVEVYKRKKENAKDSSKTIDLVLEYSKYLNKNDILILVQATSPLTTAEDIDNVIEDYKHSNCDSMLSCVRAQGFYWTQNGEPILHDKNNRKRRQDCSSQVLKENGAIYINKVKNIIENKTLLSGVIKPFIMADETKIEIDELDDIVEIENILKKRLLKNIDFKKFKMFLTDCDGTLTDGGMYYSKNGEELKKFNTKDGFGLKKIKNSGLKVGIITGEDNQIVQKRAEKLGIDLLFMGVQDKLKVVKSLAKKFKISLDEIIYIGDDMNDYEVVNSVGFGCATNNAKEELKLVSKYVTKLPGGMGAVREVVDLIDSKI